MATEPIQGGPYPAPADSPDGPSQMKGIVDWSAVRSVMRFASAAARDAAIPSPVSGMVSYLASTRSLYLCDTAETPIWRLVSQPTSETDTGWVSITPGAGWSSSALFVRRKNGVVFFSGEIWGGTLDVTILTLAPQFRPKSRVAVEVRRAVSGTAVGKLNIGVDGALEIRETNSASSSPGFSMAPVNYLAGDV